MTDDRRVGRPPLEMVAQADGDTAIAADRVERELEQVRQLVVDRGVRNGENPKPGLGVWGSRCIKLCSAVTYSPTPSRVQYHRRWQA